MILSICSPSNGVFESDGGNALKSRSILVILRTGMLRLMRDSQMAVLNFENSIEIWQKSSNSLPFRIIFSDSVRDETLMYGNEVAAFSGSGHLPSKKVLRLHLPQPQPYDPCLLTCAVLVAPSLDDVPNSLFEDGIFEGASSM